MARSRITGSMPHVALETTAVPLASLNKVISWLSGMDGHGESRFCCDSQL